MTMVAVPIEYAQQAQAPVTQAAKPPVGAKRWKPTAKKEKEPEDIEPPLPANSTQQKLDMGLDELVETEGHHMTHKQGAGSAVRGSSFTANNAKAYKLRQKQSSQRLKKLGAAHSSLIEAVLKAQELGSEIRVPPGLIEAQQEYEAKHKANRKSGKNAKKANGSNKPRREKEDVDMSPSRRKKSRRSTRSPSYSYSDSPDTKPKEAASSSGLPPQGSVVPDNRTPDAPFLPQFVPEGPLIDRLTDIQAKALAPIMESMKEIFNEGKLTNTQLSWYSYQMLSVVMQRHLLPRLPAPKITKEMEELVKSE